MSSVPPARHATKAVVVAAGEGTWLRPLTEDKPEVLVGVTGTPLIGNVFEDLIAVGIEEFAVGGGDRTEGIIERDGDAYRGVPITDAHQREQRGLAHVLLGANPLLRRTSRCCSGRPCFGRFWGQSWTDSTLMGRTRRSPSRRYRWRRPRGTGCVNGDREIVEVVEDPDDPPSNLGMTGFYTFTPAIFQACHPVQPSDRGEYELPDVIDLLIQSGRTIEAVEMESWHVDVGYSEDREQAEELLVTEPMVR